MNPLRARAGEYLAMRRSLGYKLQADERLLAGFIGHLEREGHATITTGAALEWATRRRAPPRAGTGAACR